MTYENTFFTDSRDGKKYRAVKIGSQVWMAENLNYATPDSKYYGNDAANGEKYGRLYNWNDAMKVCPDGWHLPADAEWAILLDYVGGMEIAGKKLKSKTGWDKKGNGSDEYGFSALPGGNGISGEGFNEAGDCGYWWSAAINNAEIAWGRYMGCEYENVFRYYDLKAGLYSVRCVRDS